MDKIVLPNDIFLEEVASLLDEGRDVTLSPRGSSMLPFIREGRDSVVLRKEPSVKKGDIVLVRLPGRYVMHRIIREEGEHLTLMGDGNLQGTESCTRADVLGTVHTILRDGKPRQPGDGKLWGRLLPFRRIILGIYRRLSSVSPSPEGRGFGRG